jgi:asparagine synthase (glutamine-hydrolysing)
VCGVNGIYKSKPTIGFDSLDVIRQMNDKIKHRGPDDEGFYNFNSEYYHLALGMRRLAIIDLEGGKQPIITDDTKIVLVFNGEIYNFKELKAELINSGVQFKTNSDSEVILKLYEKEGVSSFSKLDGMFVFSIYDRNIDKIYIVRDFFGEKPLYYSNRNNQFVWASELKSLLAIEDKKLEINKQGFSLFFQLTYIPAPFTIFDGVYKLESNHYLELNCLTSEYSSIEIDRNSHRFELETKKDAIRYTEELVRRSVISRSISDVPIATFLSGGVDSSIISLCLSNQQEQRIDTFSIGFKNRLYDESEKARVVAKMIKSNHHEFIVSEKDILKDIDKILNNFDEPFADSSALVSFVIANETSDSVKVALVGDGGDEVFAGYNKYYMGRVNRLYTSIVSEGVHKFSFEFLKRVLNLKKDSRGFKFKLNKFLKSVDYSNEYYFNIISLGFSHIDLNSIFLPIYQSDGLEYFKSKFIIKDNSITDYRSVDKVISLEGDMLVKVDRTSMLSSLECRAPFLNKELWDFVCQLPDNYLINGWDKKHILKEAFKKYFPEGFLDKKKKGFEVPVGDWLRSGLRTELLGYIEINFIQSQGIFNFENVSNLVHRHLEKIEDNTFKVWTFFCFQKWYKSYFYN